MDAKTDYSSDVNIVYLMHYGHRLRPIYVQLHSFCMDSLVIYSVADILPCYSFTLFKTT